MTNNLKLISEIERGRSFHYYGRPDRVFIKERPGYAVYPQDGIRPISQNTLVVSHDGKSSGIPVRKS